jgi:hypothetical protein
MSRWAFLATCVLICGANPVWANGATPAQFQLTGPTAAVVVVVDAKAEAARVQIPKKLLTQLQAAAPSESGWAGVSRFQLMAAGIFLALALGCGGFWLMRRSEKFAARGLLLMLAAIVLLSLSAAVAWGNAAYTFKQVVPAGVPLADNATVEIVEQGGAITLIVPRENLAKVLEKKP